MIRIIVAYDKNRIIGKAGNLPWKIPEEMHHFKQTTSGHPIIMGRKTWDSLPDNVKPLSKRFNIVVSSKPNLPGNPHILTPTLQKAIDVAKTINPNIWIIGGSTIYNQSLIFADEILASEINESYDGDTWFPEVPNWTKKIEKIYEKFKVVRYSKCH